jgi:hypothetical protein
MTMAEIQVEVNNLEKESKAIKKELYKLAWFMRGGISLAELYVLDTNDREILSELIQENLETTKNSGLPFF